MCLGQYVFGIDTTSYDNLRRSLAWRHPSTSRVGVRPARQFLGRDDESITLAGIVYPEISPDGRVSLQDLEAMGDTGDKYLLVGGDHHIYGQFVIESLETTGTIFLSDGTPQKIEFSLKLTRVDDDNEGAS
ncbi:phage tail protein [Uliginosibacterium gangwonense]|uniref:phage tail protein n=1 Tax=Uliginosibacterium gangwonense TaxID=392736 RepID=UPI0003A2644E|nr:phage tail protein [Uliginosibacterium gangwonense]